MKKDELNFQHSVLPKVYFLAYKTLPYNFIKIHMGPIYVIRSHLDLSLRIEVEIEIERENIK